VQPRIDHDNVIELVRQVFLGRGAQVINRLAHGPVFGGHHDFALHQTTSGIFGIGQRLFDSDPVRIFQGPQNGLGLRILKVFDQIDNIIAVHVAHGVRQHLGRQNRNDFLADRFVELRQNLAIELAVIEPDQLGPFKGADLFQKVGDVGRVQRLHQLCQLGGVIDFHRIENGRHGLFVQPICLAFILGVGGEFKFLCVVNHGCPHLRFCADHKRATARIQWRGTLRYRIVGTAGCG